MVQRVSDVAVLIVVQPHYEDMVGTESFFCLTVSEQKGEGSSHLHFHFIAMMVLLKLFLAQDLSEHVDAFLEAFDGVGVLAEI